MNLDSLRRKREKRLGLKSGNRAGGRRILFILDRATRKFHGDLALWMQYLLYARQQKAFKKVSEILTSLVRLHPTKPEVWIYAAAYAIDEQGDMTEARGYMQRGLRFCKRSRNLWLEYAKLELMYIAKIIGRQRILGLNQGQQHEAIPAKEDSDADMISLPTLTAEDINPNLRVEDDGDQDALQNLNATPALSGAIPIAIFDASMEQFKDDTFGESFFAMVGEFQHIPCVTIILQHIADQLSVLFPSSPLAIDCFNRQPIMGVEPTSPLFPDLLRTTINRLKSSMEDIPSLVLAERTISWMLPYLNSKLETNLCTVIKAILTRVTGYYMTTCKKLEQGSIEDVARILGELQEHGLEKDEPLMLPWALEKWSTDDRLKPFEAAASGTALISA